MHRFFTRILFCSCLVACGQTPTTLDDLILEKNQKLQASQAALFENAQAYLERIRETKPEADKLIEAKLKRLESGEPFDDLMAQEEPYRSEVDEQRARSEELYITVVEDLTDFYGLLAALSSYCDADIDRLINTMNLQSLEDGLPDDVNAQTMFWDKKFEYGAVVESHATNFSCEQKLPLINQIIEIAEART